MTGPFFTFLTHDGGRPLTRGVVIDRRHEPLDARPIDMRGAALMAAGAVDACAYGKVVVLDQQGISTFQATAEGATAPVFCGNSTAAAIVCLGAADSLRIKLHGVASAPYDVDARITGPLVSQTWMVPPAMAREREWNGLRAVFLPALNDYAIVFGELPDDMPPETARRELLGVDPACKLAVVSHHGMVSFYNSNGRHGGAPQTGLATIALAKHSVPWLAEIFVEGFVSHRTAAGVLRARLPTTVRVGDRIAVEMPSVSVDIAPVAMERVA